MLQGFRLCGGDKGAMKTDEVCDRLLDPLGAATFGVVCYSICSQQEIPLPECYFALIIKPRQPSDKCPHMLPGLCYAIEKCTYACSNCELYSSA